MIAKSKDGVSRVDLTNKNKKTGKGGRLTERLTDLENTGFIKKMVPFESKTRGIYYKISDEYCYFYIKWIDPIKNQLNNNSSTDFWKPVTKMPEFYNWQGLAFENICFKHITQIKKALELSPNTFASTWRYKSKNNKEMGAQIDLLFHGFEDFITLCVIKFTDSAFKIDKEYAQKLILRKNI